MKKIALICIPILILTFSCTHEKKANNLRSQIEQIAQQANGKVGIAIMNMESGDTLTYNGKLHLPMQSVFKFPVAMAILNKADSGKLTLEQKVHISKEQMAEKMWSPMHDKYPDGNIDISISDLLSYMVSQSDGIACDVLIDLAGGPKQVESYMHSLGAKDIAIAANELQMHAAWDVQYSDWCEPQQMMYILNNFYLGKYLAPGSTAFLTQLMANANTGVHRIKGLLPKGTIVVHKTGSSDTKDGITAATNDIGVVTLPNGNHFILVAFVSDSKANDSTRDAVIAQIARAVYDNDCSGKSLQ